jgi:hypothetical protein
MLHAERELALGVASLSEDERAEFRVANPLASGASRTSGSAQRFVIQALAVYALLATLSLVVTAIIAYRYPEAFRKRVFPALLALSVTAYGVGFVWDMALQSAGRAIEGAPLTAEQSTIAEGAVVARSIPFLHLLFGLVVSLVVLTVLRALPTVGITAKRRPGDRRVHLGR